MLLNEIISIRNILSLEPDKPQEVVLVGTFFIFLYAVNVFGYFGNNLQHLLTLRVLKLPFK